MDDLTTPKKELGQHWLMDRSTLSSIAELASIDNGDTVLEIGPGLGSLTEILLEKAGIVIAVEYDESLYANLKQRFMNEPRLTIVSEDIRRFNLLKLPQGYKVVANIPYYLTSYLIRLISQTQNPPLLAVLLIQQEVAARIAAKPGELSVLGVMTQTYWDVELGPVVPPEMFTPPPKVNSQVVKLERLSEPLIPSAEQKEFFQTVKIGFSQKRKTLANSLSGGFRIEKAEAREVLADAGIKVGARAQELSLEDWQRLTSVIFTKK